MNLHRATVGMGLLLLICGGSPASRLVIAGDESTTALASWRRGVDAVLDADEFRRSHWGLLAVDLKTGDVLYDRNAEKMFAPASVTKLFSVAAALDELGADHHYVTRVYTRGTVDDDGRLSGDLILVAAGDPTLGGRTDADGKITYHNADHTYAGFAGNAELTDVDPTAGLQALARRLAETGLREVQGDVLIDDRLFTHAEGSGTGPKRLTPIVVNDNVLDFTFAPADEQGRAATIAWRPQTSAFTVDSQVDTVAADGATRIYITEPTVGQIVVRGTIALNRKPLVLVHEVSRPASFARSLFIEALRGAGVKVAASPLADNDTDRLPRFETYAAMKSTAEFRSPPLSESAKLTLKVSHNLHAGLLPLVLAAKHGKRTLSDGLQLQGAALKRLGVDVESLSFGGGAGGDRADYVTPKATVQLLTAMTRHDDFAAYRDALPVLGVDGTLSSAAGEDSPARGHVRAKTGTLVWSDLLNHRTLLQSKALAGYVDAANGRTIVFACFVNLAPLTTASDRERIGRVLGTIAEKLYAAP